MNLPIPFELFSILVVALVGGIIFKLLKLQPLVGYIVAGVIVSAFFPMHPEATMRLAEVGAILLLFSIGIELSLEKLGRVWKIAVIGGLIQIVLVTLLTSLFLQLTGFNLTTAIILSMGFSLSSTAVVVKILSDRGEIDTIHGEVMIGWLLVQDLVVIPMMVVLSIMTSTGNNVLLGSILSLGKALLVVAGVVVLGKTLVPLLIHKVAAANSRELLLLSSLVLAIGTAALTSLFGISPALGAFLAGVVVSESQENHAVFAETRPLRDLFVALFFVTLGFLISPTVVITHLPLILVLVLFVLVIKFIVVFLVTIIFGYHGKTAVANAIGLSQVGEFSFILFSSALALKLISPENTSIGIAVTLFTLVVTPILFKAITPFWRKIRSMSASFPVLSKLLLGWDKKNISREENLENHIVICGFGRVGGWVGRAMESLGTPFIVIDYNQKVVNDLKVKGINVIYGDPSEPEILEAASLDKAKAVVMAIPDMQAQGEIISLIQNRYPDVKIISRVHRDEDWEKIKLLKIEKLVQPEFEASLAIVKSILSSMGKSKEEISDRIKKLRLSRAMN